MSSANRFKATGQHLGDYELNLTPFKEHQVFLTALQQPKILHLNPKQKFHFVSEQIAHLVLAHEEPCFLLPKIVVLLNDIEKLNVSPGYNFASLELWLNQFSHFSEEENSAIRSKIAGKRIPRDEYQIYFPIGTGKQYPGTHFVTAHGSPDLDTTISSFWGWVDAFAARVGRGLHIWNVPGGHPSNQVEVPLLFDQMLGSGIFTNVAKVRTSLLVSSLDLLSQKGFREQKGNDNAFSFEHDRNQAAVVMIDDKGFYLGDWRGMDVEGVQQVIQLLLRSLWSLETRWTLSLIALFAKEDPRIEDYQKLLQDTLKLPIDKQPFLKGFTVKQRSLLSDLMTKALGFSMGLNASFTDFALHMDQRGVVEFASVLSLVENFFPHAIFDREGNLKAQRTSLMAELKKVADEMESALSELTTFMEKLSMALEVKFQVFGRKAQPLTHRASYEEIRAKIEGYSYLTVTLPDMMGNLVPMGIVTATDIYQTTLGTVTLRDFCNREETKIPAYLEIISVVDHHKSTLNTSSPSVVIVSDAQATSSLIAEQAFKLNQKYSLAGQSVADVAKQMEQVKADLSSPVKMRLMKRLLKKSLAIKARQGYVAFEREWTEYLHFLYGILDDTDLLTKVTPTDVKVMAELLNRLKSLSMGEEVEIITLEDLEAKPDFAKLASKRLLQHPEMFSLYRKVYDGKEKAIDTALVNAAKAEDKELFFDTKTQNNCCRVGQIKMFTSNFKTYQSHANSIRRQWLDESMVYCKAHPEVDLYLEMMSTLANAEDLYRGKTEIADHLDELLIWIPNDSLAIQHLKLFISNLAKSQYLIKEGMELELCGSNASALDQIFTESFLPVPRRADLCGKENLPIAVLRFKAGSMNSRKEMISPFLPKFA